MPRATLKRTAFIASLVVYLSYGAPAAMAADAVTLSPRVIAVGKWAEGIAYDGRAMWVAESGQRTIAQVDLQRGAVSRRVTVGRLPVGMVLGSDGAVYALVETDRLLWQQFPNQPNGTALKGLQGCPQALASGDQFLWVVTWLAPKGGDCNSDTAQVIRIDPRRGDRISSPVLGPQAMAVIAYRGKVWVAHSQGAAIEVLDGQSMAPSPSNVQGAFVAVAANSGNVHAGGQVGGNNSQGLVVAIDASTFREVRRQVVDQAIVAMTEDARNVVAAGAQGKIFVFSADSLELQRTITLTSGKLQPEALLIQGDDLYVSNHQQQGENGAILVVSGWRPAAAPAPAPAPAPTPAPTPSPSPSPPAANATDCPYQVVNVSAETGLWMYEDPDESAPKVIAIPLNARGLVADRCITGWCHVTYRGSSGWVERRSIQAYCN